MTYMVGDAYERQRSLSLLMERLDAEVMTCFADSGEGESGIAGSDAKLTLGSRGVGLSGNRAETLGLSSTQFSTYELSGSELKVSRLEQAGAQPMVLVVRGVGKVRFRYHDGKEWKTSFDSMNAKVLPLAIEVSVWFASTLSQAQQEPISATDSEFVEGTDAAEAGATVEIPPDRVRVFVIPDGARADRGTSDLGWAIDFYVRHGFRLIGEAEKNRLLRRYWSIPARQIETSVVLVGPAGGESPSHAVRLFSGGV